MENQGELEYAKKQAEPHLAVRAFGSLSLKWKIKVS
jgi:hypothetical protein